MLNERTFQSNLYELKIIVVRQNNNDTYSKSLFSMNLNANSLIKPKPSPLKFEHLLSNNDGDLPVGLFQFEKIYTIVVFDRGLILKHKNR